MARGPAVIQSAMVSNPYPQPREHVPRWTHCELCDRTVPTKDWGTHKGSKKHRALENKEREEIERAKNPAGFGGNAADLDTPFPNANNEFGSSDSFGNFATTTGDDGWGTGGDFSTTNTSYNHNGSDRACYGCGQTGHQKRDCPTSGGGGGGNACYGCGMTGHQKRDCPQASGSQACYNCGETG